MSLLRDFLDYSLSFEFAKKFATKSILRMARNLGYTLTEAERALDNIKFETLYDKYIDDVLEAATSENADPNLVESLTYLPDIVQFLNSRAGKNFIYLLEESSKIGSESVSEWLATDEQVKSLRDAGYLLGGKGSSLSGHNALPVINMTEFLKSLLGNFPQTLEEGDIDDTLTEGDEDL